MTFPQQLLGKISQLGADARSDDLKARKFAILSIALANFSTQSSSTKVEPLADPGTYVLSSTVSPEYFNNAFANKTVTVQAVPTVRYDYASSGKSFEVWVDFAANRLGGGIFGNGMLQEETMMASMPELADAAAGDLWTRGKPVKPDQGQGVLNSSPTPLVITAVHRTIDLDPALYGDGWKTIPMNQLLRDITALEQPQPAVNILAIAVPKLTSELQQTQLDTIKDLFNTFVAGYHAATANQKDVLINTGPIGTGDFKHSKAVIYVMQRLAAQHVGVNMRYWALQTGDQKIWDQVVVDIIKDYTAAHDASIIDLLSIAQKHLQKGN